MNRKSFLNRSAALGAIGSLTLLSKPVSAACSCTSSADGTSCEKQFSFAQTWLKRMMEVLDHEVDETTREKILLANGKRCHEGYLGASGNPPSPKLSLEEFVGSLNQKNIGTFAVRAGNRVIFGYGKDKPDPAAEKNQCLCPFVENGPQGLSGNYCLCSVGYVKNLFDWALGEPVQKVNLLESIKQGGNTCRFEIVV
jgi:hypothetical protein